ncbi:hypothetical protein COLO4_31833 [Corchorus olitorius]|uniref:AAA+ ATPase domain-containing protein n=1 Tax=Corchorus olitorius TaxID=93759 RepID=A0A1R3H352_9ROSI|nr:hypothetical protein COLO4_31833 [Corchorus olitorius]
MAVLQRLLRTARSWRRIAPAKTLNPSRAQSRDFTSPFYHHKTSFPQVAAKPPLPSEPPANHANLEEIAKKERQRIEDLLKDKGLRYGSYPRFTVAVKGQKVAIKFQIPPSCEIAQLIANLVSNLGLKVEEHGGGSDMLLRAWDSSVAWQLTLNPLEKQKETGVSEGHSVEKNGDRGDLCILIFHSLISSDKAVGLILTVSINIVEIEFMKQGSLNPKELDALVSVLQLAGGKLGQNKTTIRRPMEGSPQVPSVEKSITSLEAMGVKIYGLDALHQTSSNSDISWDNIAGYDQQKRDIEDTILLALNSPKVYDDIARGTRRKFESNRPRAVLFEGPPGTGKTSCARVIANQAGVPLLYVPLEIVMSKYYGESERLLGQVFSLANQLPDGALIFLDEVDAFAIARDGEIHEATRRLLSVLLRQIDGFEQDKKVVVIAATNRKQDLDPALISRFDSLIEFGLPDEQNRREIAAQYAKHLAESELVELARVTDEMSGRDIRDVCQQAERSWASKLIRGKATNNEEQQSLPPLEEYIKTSIDLTISIPANSILSIESEKTRRLADRSFNGVDSHSESQLSESTLLGGSLESSSSRFRVLDKNPASQAYCRRFSPLLAVRFSPLSIAWGKKVFDVVCFDRAAKDIFGCSAQEFFDFDTLHPFAVKSASDALVGEMFRVTLKKAVKRDAEHLRMTEVVPLRSNFKPVMITLKEQYQAIYGAKDQV